MANLITRKFTMDLSNMYFINNGIISRRSIVEFVESYTGIYNMLKDTGKNVGWCTAKECLMFTDGDEIYRVDADLVVNMMLDLTTYVHSSQESDVIVLRYDSDVYTDDKLIIKENYKDFEHTISEPYDIGRVPKSTKEKFSKCLIIEDNLSVYSIKKGHVYKEHILDYIARNGMMWSNRLVEGIDNSDFILNNKNVALRVMDGRIDRIDKSKVEKIIRYSGTKLKVETSSLYDYLVVEYDNEAFPDSELCLTS